MKMDVFEKKMCEELEKKIEDLVKEATTREEVMRAYDLLRQRANLKANKERINPNSIISAVSSLAGILMIINHERLNVITSKALGFIIRPKI